jgi:hypothetical protein
MMTLFYQQAGDQAIKPTQQAYYNESITGLGESVKSVAR